VERLSPLVRKRLESAIHAPRRRAELLTLGLTDPDLRRLVRRSALHHHYGHYVGGHLDEHIARIMCAQTAHAASVVSHFTSAGLTELRTWVDSRRTDAPPTASIWLTCPPRTGRHQRDAGLVLRLASIDAPDIRRHNRLLITRESRTVVDLARELPMREAVVTVDHALAVAVTRKDLMDVVDRQCGWPGIRSARDAVLFGDPRSESALESIARVAFAAAGLPPPVPQASLWDGERWMPERVDFWWPQFRTIAEADGLAKFEAGSPAERRRLHRMAFRREQRLADRGVELLRFGWEDAVLEPEALAWRLTQAFARGANRPGAVPRWRSADPTDARLWPRMPPPDVCSSAYR
jgi:hypothetical protein